MVGQHILKVELQKNSFKAVTAFLGEIICSLCLPVIASPLLTFLSKQHTRSNIFTSISFIRLLLPFDIFFSKLSWDFIFLDAHDIWGLYLDCTRTSWDNFVLMWRQSCSKAVTVGSSLRTWSIDGVHWVFLCGSLIHMAGSQGGLQDPWYATHKDIQYTASSRRVVLHVSTPKCHS